MSLFAWVKNLYSLETLDARLNTSSTTPLATSAKLDPAKNAPSENGNLSARDGREKIAAQAGPSLWNTPEYYWHYFIFIVAIPNMARAVYDVSQPSHPNYKNFEHLLSDGWIPGRKVDNSDGQYSGFRDNLPYMLALLFIHPLLRRLYNKIIPASVIPGAGLSASAIAAQARYEQGITFDRYFGLIFLTALNGASVPKILFILYTNYLIAHRLPRSYIPIGTWVFNVAILFANELLHGYPYEAMARVLLPLGADKDGKNWGSILDSYGGLMPRWEVLFKITILRMISYNMDYYWSLTTGGSSMIEKKQLDPAALSERDRVSISAEPRCFNLRSYFAYILYSPLYLAGPVLTFNDYTSQRHYPLPHMTWSRVVRYGIRFVVCLLTMEVMMHFMYSVAISNGTPDWSVYGSMELGMLGYWNLNHIWLKLLLPWRFFRLWALADGIDPPENMIRCMSDNYSALAFWRGWHRSLNRWIVRYIYVPLETSSAPAAPQGPGQAKGKTSVARRLFNFLTVFTFVACWHDINLRLLTWGWMIVLFVAPEILAGIAFPARKWRDLPTPYRMLCGLGGVANVFGMMAANLVGFAVGVEGLQRIVHGVVSSWLGYFYFLVAAVVLFSGVQVMFEHREEEKRHGINLRC